MHLRRLLLLALGLLALPACDLLEPPPDVPPPDGATHPFGEGNGKVVFLSDLASAEQIDVTLGGEPIGAVTRFVGCPGQVTTDDGLATAIRPAGRYQYSASSPTGGSWASTEITVVEDAVTGLVFVGPPSQYAVHLPEQIAGLPVNYGEEDFFHFTTRTNSGVELTVTRPPSVQGDQIEVVLNDTVIAQGVALGTQDLSFDLALAPGPNYLALRLSRDVDGDGAQINAYLYEGDDRLGAIQTASSSTHTDRWEGVNVRYSC